MSIRRFKKACNCPGSTASGPRAVISYTRETDESFVRGLVFHEYACDACDAPWEELHIDAEVKRHLRAVGQSA